MLITIRAVLFIGATWRRGPTFYWGFQEPLRENFEGPFQCNLCCNTLSVRTIMNFLNLCDSFGFSFMISKVLEFIHSLILNYLTYFENVSLYNEAMKSACIYSYCFDKLFLTFKFYSNIDVLHLRLPSLKILQSLFLLLKSSFIIFLQIHCSYFLSKIFHVQAKRWVPCRCILRTNYI